MATITIYLKRGDVDAATRAFQMAKLAHSQGVSNQPVHVRRRRDLG
jgi:GH24 family phage-related lysozyme (muramidase)